jgi:hypothetical protein
MTFWLAGLCAAGVAWIVNVFLVKRGGDWLIIWVIPWLEEGIKTGTALLFGTSVPYTHSIFGLIEAVHDYYASPRWGYWAALSSLFSHWFFGQCTIYVQQKTDSWSLGVIGAGFVHTFWNYLLVHIFSAMDRPEERR